MNRRSGRVAIGLVAVVSGVLASGDAEAATINWKGHTWQVTSGGMAGVCQGSPANVTIDANGYLHFRISNAGGNWTASEIFTTDRLAFGTYQWQIDGPIDTYDKNVVLGLFPYGPAAGIGGDGTNEIDIEYARWGVANGPNGDWTNYPASGTTIGELSYTFSLGGSTLSTSRFVWTKTSITSSLLGGIQPVGGNDSLIKTWTYMPSNPTVNIPQQALPLGMNLWCFSAPPSDGQPVEIIVRDFTFVPEGAGGAGGGGTGGAAGRGGAGGNGGVGGTAGAGARGGGGGAGGGGRGGSAGTGGAGGSGIAGMSAGGRGGGGGAAGAGATGAAGTTGAGGATGAAGATGAGGGAAGSGIGGMAVGGNGGRGGDGAAGGSGVAGTTIAGTGGSGATGGSGVAGTTIAGTGGSGAGGASGNVAGDGNGCGCRVRGADEAGTVGIAVILAVGVAASRRRRRHGPS